MQTTFSKVLNMHKDAQRRQPSSDIFLTWLCQQDSSHACVMLTGDAPLTALSVAVEAETCLFHGHGPLALCASFMCFNSTKGNEQLCQGC
jgi:hypothetical protein